MTITTHSWTHERSTPARSQQAHSLQADFGRHTRTALVSRWVPALLALAIAVVISSAFLVAMGAGGVTGSRVPHPAPGPAVTAPGVR